MDIEAKGFVEVQRREAVMKTSLSALFLRHPTSADKVISDAAAAHRDSLIRVRLLFLFLGRYITAGSRGPWIQVEAIIAR